MRKETWFITGASRGLGKAFALHAIEQGYQVVATARRQESLQELVQKAPDRVLALSLDVTQKTQVEEAVKAAEERFGRVDVLLNNAGFGMVGAVEETPEHELRAIFETNFFEAISLTNAMLPLLRRQRKGAVVNISSMGGQLAFPGFGPYCATKFALEGISESLRAELQPLGIKVMIVEPGAFRTDFAGAALRHMPRIDDYQETVGGTREFASSMHETQEGDPAKAAAAVDEALKAENTPLRLALGQDSYDAVFSHAQALLEEMAEWKETSLSTAFQEATA